MVPILRRLYRAALCHYILVCLALACLLYLPSLGVGFYADDLWHQTLLDVHARGADRRDDLELCLDLWSLDAGLPAPSGPGYLRAGSPYALPWFRDPDLKLRFFRPLTGWTLLLDHRLGVPNPLGDHVVNFLLWVLLVAAVLALHRSLLPDTPDHRPALLLAGLFFVFDEGHAIDISWIAARHELLSVLLSVTSLVFYDRYRQRGGIWRLLPAVACLGFALLAGETALAMIFWIAAWEVFLARDSVRSRLLHSAPMTLLLLGFIVFYTTAGYGTAGSSWYMSPFDRPLELVRAVPERLTAYVVGALTPLPPEVSHMAPASLAAAGMLLALALLLGLVPYLWKRPVQRCAAVAALGSLVFLCIALPFNYKMLFPSVGVSLVLATFTTGTVRRLRTTPPGAWRRAGLWAAVALVVLIHGIATPFEAVLATKAFEQAALLETREQWRSSVDWPVDREAADVYLLSSPGAWSSLFLPYRDFRIEGRLVRDYIPILFRAVDYEMTRLGPATLRLRSTQGFFTGYFPRAMAMLVRGDPDFRAGERFARRGLTVWVEEVRDGNPTQIAVRFPRDLDDPSVWLLSYDGVRTHRIRAPRIGQTERSILHTPG